MIATLAATAVTGPKNHRTSASVSAGTFPVGPPIHRRSKGIEDAQFVAFELGHAVLQITPKKHDWKRPLWRVFRSKITYVIDGRTQRLEIAEMTSWRGNWYVTKLR